MARPRPAAPSSRVYLAFGIAAALGLAIFVIWWFTSPSLRSGATGATGAQAPVPPQSGAPQGGASQGAAQAPQEPVLTLPRGGSLTGAGDLTNEPVTWLTQATLVRINRATDSVDPWLAESWTASADNRTYTLKLRPNIHWSDGTPLSVEDVVASVAAVKMSTFVLAARALDALTIEVVFPEPFAPGLRLLDRYPIVPRHASSNAVGLGPFVAAKPGPERQGARTFVRNPHYWRKAPDGSALPYLDELTISGTPGSYDFDSRAISPDDYEALKTLEQSGKLRLFDLGPGLDADALWFSPASGADAATAGKPGQDRPWLTSERFRLAISAAVDRRVYCRQVWFGACDPIAGPVTPANAAWFNPDLPLGQGNPQLAREMLAELGLLDRSGDGMLDDAAGREVKFSLLIRRGMPTSARAAVFLAETLRAVGVGVEVTQLAGEQLLARRQKGNYDAIYDRIEVRDTDPAMNLDFWLSSGTAHVWSPARQGRPADWERQIDQLMLKHAATYDRTERLQAFAEVQRIYSQHMPALFFGAPHVRVFTSTRVLNATPSPLRPYLLWNAENLAALQ